MNFGLYLLALVCPPLYFLTRKRIGATLLHCILFGVSLILFITIVGIPIAIILWLVCIVHALWNVRSQLVTEQAEVIATKMAEKMRLAPIPLTPQPPHTQTGAPPLTKP